MTEAHVAKSLTRRIDPARKMLHVLGVSDADVAGKRWTVDRIAVIALRVRKLAVLARYVDTHTWNPAILDQMRADAAWVADQSRFHERVLARVMRAAPVVPVRFFTAYDSAQGFDRAARENYQRWRRSLARLRGKYEWRLRVYHGPHAAPSTQPYALLAASPGARPQSVHVAPHVADHLIRLWKCCGALATAARSIDCTLEPQRSFEAVFLLSADGTPKFHEALIRWAASAKPLGLTYYVEGPRPPFTFA